MKKGMCGVHKLAALLLFVGGINWGLVAIDPSYNLISMLFSDPSMMATGSRVVYGLVGLSALLMLGACRCCMKCSRCEDGKCDMHDGKMMK